MKSNMKFSVGAFLIVSVAIAAGTLFYLDRQEVLPVPGTLPVQVKSNEVVAPNVEEPRNVSANSSAPAQIPAKNPVSSDTVLSNAGTASSSIIDGLISIQTSFSEKLALINQLQAAGGLDQAIAELKQRAAVNPDDPEIPTALGELNLGKIPATQDFSEKAILGREADQYFNAALSVDPANWDAQFVKASALSGWPTELNKDPEVIQQLSSLIEQQQTMTPQAQFARTYILLGDEYQKLGQSDNARQAWQLGAQKFPDDSELRKRIAHP